MKQDFYINICFFLILAMLAAGFQAIPPAGAKGIKTSYKRYSIFQYKDDEILCEPYTVKKDDWLYKIFRKKGEISEKDFPHFLLIFKELNPQISNIDAIEPGNPILIPLKKVDKDDYDLSTPVNVDVPVIEFSSLPEDKILEPFIKKHKIKKGESISTLIDKDFLEKGGKLSEEGLKAFQLANPNIQNINIIYEGRDIYLPDPSIKSQPWFQSFFPGKSKGRDSQNDLARDAIQPEPPPLDQVKLLQLRRYASMIGGTLLSQGKMYFPGNDGGSQVLDLSSAPIIETKDGKKILVMSGINQNDLLLERVRQYWKDIRIQMMSETIEELKETISLKKKTAKEKKKNKALFLKKQIEYLLSQTDYDYIPNAKIPFTLNNIQLEASFGRIIQTEQADVLINFGNVYGNALDVLQKKEFKIISITSQLSTMETVKTLFSAIGYSTWENPSFFTGAKVEAIIGIYVVKGQSKIFVPETELSPTAIRYLENEEIRILTPLPGPR